MLWTLMSLAVALGPTVESTLDKAEATIGELIAYRLTVQHPESLTVPAPRLPVPPGVRLASTAAPQVVEAEPGVLRTTFRYALAAYQTGNYLLPPTDVTLVEPSGETMVIPTDTLFFSVRSVLEAGADTTDILDVKPPVPPGWAPPPWALGIAGLAAVGALVALILRLGRGRPPKLPPPPPPEELARERIRRLRGVVPADSTALKRYYSDISFLLRDYVETRLSLPALESTTSEILTRLGQRDGSPAWVGTLGCVLGEADLVKFAKHQPSVEEAHRALDSAELIVETVRREETHRETTVLGRIEADRTAERTE
jgi:hypothetical protein